MRNLWKPYIFCWDKDLFAWQVAVMLVAAGKGSVMSISIISLLLSLVFLSTCLKGKVYATNKQNEQDLPFQYIRSSIEGTSFISQVLLPLPQCRRWEIHSLA